MHLIIQGYSYTFRYQILLIAYHTSTLCKISLGWIFIILYVVSSVVCNPKITGKYYVWVFWVFFFLRIKVQGVLCWLWEISFLASVVNYRLKNSQTICYCYGQKNVRWTKWFTSMDPQQMQPVVSPTLLLYTTWFWYPLMQGFLSVDLLRTV